MSFELIQQWSVAASYWVRTLGEPGGRWEQIISQPKSNRKALLFFCFLNGLLQSQEQAIGIRFISCRDAGKEPVDRFLALVRILRVEFWLVVKSKWYTEGGHFLMKWEMAHHDVKPWAKICLDFPLYSGNDDLLPWSLPREIHWAEKIEEHACVWWQISQGEVKNLEQQQKNKPTTTTTLPKSTS